MDATRDETHASDKFIDLMVYAPVGIALEAVDSLPKYIERGRSQVTLVQFFARSAARKGSSSLGSLGERLVQEAGQVVVDLFGIDLSPDSEEPDDTSAENPVPDESAAADDSELPVPNYDSQAASQIVKLLGQLTHAEREQVDEYERSGKNRLTILRKIEQLRPST